MLRLQEEMFDGELPPNHKGRWWSWWRQGNYLPYPFHVCHGGYGEAGQPHHSSLQQKEHQITCWMSSRNFCTLAQSTSVGAYSNCSGEFGAKILDFRDEGLNIFNWRHGSRNDGWWLVGIKTGLQLRFYKFCNIKDSLIHEPCLLLCTSKLNSEECFSTFFGNMSLKHSWHQDTKKPIRLLVGPSVL